LGGGGRRGGKGDGEGGEELGVAAAAQAPGDKGGEEHQQSAGQGGEEPDRDQRPAERGERPLGGDGDEGREVHGPEPEVAGHGEVKEFVALEAVGGEEVDGEMGAQDEQGEQDGQGERGGRGGLVGRGGRILHELLLLPFRLLVR
jgi:hypothetical protein